MNAFVTRDDRGNFILDGSPWFLHAATYFGRRPGTCGGDWLGDNFEHNLSVLDRDLETMHRLGINSLGLFVSNPSFFNGLDPVESRFDQLERFLDRLKAAGMRAVMFDLFVFRQETWCELNGIEPGDSFWNPAVNPEAERASIATKTRFRSRFADRREIIGWATGCPRFFRFGFDVPPVRDAWITWLRHRFDWDFECLRDRLDLEADERDWASVRMPTEMPEYFNHRNPRSFEFALMHQGLVTRALNRIMRAVRSVTPHHLMITDMEGCCFSGGHLTSFVPEQIESDALWLESYHWEGMRSYPFQDTTKPMKMPEPAAHKPSVEILNAAGYVQLLTRLMQRSRLPLILCHGVDIGEKKRGVRNENDQEHIIDRYNTWFLESGGRGVSYWCWSDDELSKTYTKQFGIEYDTDTDPSKKKYWQAGETMGVVRYDGSERPVTEKIKAVSERMKACPPTAATPEVLVLLPSPVFQSVYRYRANQSVFGIFTSLARQGILADAAMTSAGEVQIGFPDLEPYALLIVGANCYWRDHAATPDVLLEYVEQGGNLFFSLGSKDAIVDPWLKKRTSVALAKLTGCEACTDELEPDLASIRGIHPSFDTGALDAWSVHSDEPVAFKTVRTVPEAEVLATAGDRPLLYRHRVGRGTVYVFTWNLDVFIYRGETLDHYSDAWDWLWKGIAADSGLSRDTDNPIRRSILRMMDGSALETNAP